MIGVLQVCWAFLRQFVLAWFALTRSTRELAALLYHITGELPEESDHSLLRVVLMTFLCEVESYRFFGKTITGATWIYGKEGPVPRELPNALQWLMNMGAVSLREKT